MLKFGQLNTLTVTRHTANGVYLADDDTNEVLLPNKYVPSTLRTEDTIEVFLYKDSEDRPVATTLRPKLMVNEYAMLKVKDVSHHGAFFDWGLEKDLLVPRSMQAKPIEEGDAYVVYLYLDEKSDRLVGSTKLNITLERSNVELTTGDEVALLAYEETNIGISVIVDKKYQGMIFKNEIFKPVKPGDELTGFVKKIREDNKIDVSLNRFGYKAVEDHVKRLLDALEASGGNIDLNDKSAPEDIADQLKMSKKLFKKAVGALYKKRQLEMTDTGIKLISNKKN